MGASAAEHVAVTLKALADPLRLRMLSLIASSPRGEACVGDIASVAEVSQPTVSHHLKVLNGVGVLTSQRRATWIFYSAAPQARRAATTLLDAVVVRSAGSAPADDVHAVVRAVLAELAGDADGSAYPKPLTDDAVRAADVIITMGCGDTCPILPGKRYEDWIVGDPA